jgi:hypothetical protein
LTVPEVPIRMPKMSMTMEEGEFSNWLVSVGDTIIKGQAVAVVMTDKVAGQDPDQPADRRAQCPSWFDDLWMTERAWRNQRASLVCPSRARITARVISSASVIFGAIPTFGRHGARSGEAFNRSSVRT